MVLSRVAQRAIGRELTSPARTLILAKRNSRVLIETPQSRSRCQSISDGRLFSPPIHCRRMPSSLRTTVARTTTPTVRRKRMRPFPGLHVADNTCASISAGLLAHYMQVRRCLCAPLDLACVGRLPWLHTWCSSAGRLAQGVRRCTSRCRPRIDADVHIPVHVERQIGSNTREQQS